MPFRFRGFAVESFSGLFQKIGHDMDRASSRSVFSCCPGPPSRAMSCRCLSPDLWLPGCAADRGYPVLDVFLSRERSERGTRPVVDEASWPGPCGQGNG